MTAPLRHGHWPRSTWRRSPFAPLLRQGRCALFPATVAPASVVSPAGGNATSSRWFFSAPLSRPSSFASSTPTSSVLLGTAFGLQPSRGLTLPGNSAADSDSEDNASSPDGPAKKSRNQMKREARRAVRWAMDLAEFPKSQIKRILSVPGLGLGLLEGDIYDALMLVKRLGPDVREGKRRQFNYIGRLLRDAEIPEPGLLDGLIQASKEHDNSRFQALSGLEVWTSDEQEEEEELDSDEDGDGVMDATMRWYNGLISKDTAVEKEVYSLYDVEFDRQELRKLVRKIQTVEEDVESGGEKGENITLTKTKGSLLRFLRRIARQTSLIA